jgi:hypothetical protein
MERSRLCRPWIAGSWRQVFFENALIMERTSPGSKAASGRRTPKGVLRGVPQNSNAAGRAPAACGEFFCFLLT